MLIKILLLVCIGSYHASNVPFKIVRGIYEQEIHNAIYYESSIPLLYEINIPTFANEKIENRNANPMIRALNDIRLKALENMKAIIPFIEEGDTHGKRIVTRSLDFIGDFEQWCCGVATEKNLQDILSVESSLEKFGKQMELQISRDHSEAIRMSQVLNNYTINIDGVLRQMENQVGRDFYALATDEKDLRNLVSDNSKGLLKFANSWLDSVMASAWQKVTSYCQNKLIPHMLVSPEILNEDLKKVSKVLQKHKQELAIGTNRIGQYYSLPITSCSFSKEKLIVNVKVPIRREKIKYIIKEITTIPFQNNAQVCMIHLEATLIAIGDDKVIKLTGNEEKNCRVKENGLCFIPRYTKNHFTQDSCIEELVNPFSSVETLRKNCVFSCLARKDETLLIEVKDTCI